VQFGFSDIVQLLSGGIILITIIESIFVYKSYEIDSYYKIKTKRLDAQTAAFLILAYLITILFLVLCCYVLIQLFNQYFIIISKIKSNLVLLYSQYYME
jgi:hypothetical protein